MEYKKLNENAKKCMFVGTLTGMIVTVGIFIAIYIGVVTSIPETYKALATIIFVTIIIICIVYLMISPSIRYKRYKYCINEEKIDVIEGLFFITRTIVPIERIHKISLLRGPIDNFFGLSKVIITTAGGDAVIRFLETTKADEIAESLKTKINKIANEKEEV